MLEGWLTSFPALSPSQSDFSSIVLGENYGNHLKDNVEITWNYIQRASPNLFNKLPFTFLETLCWWIGQEDRAAGDNKMLCSFGIEVITDVALASPDMYLHAHTQTCMCAQTHVDIEATAHAHIFCPVARVVQNCKERRGQSKGGAWSSPWSGFRINQLTKVGDLLVGNSHTEALSIDGYFSHYISNIENGPL